MPNLCRRAHRAIACLMLALTLTAGEAFGQFTSLHAPARSQRGQPVNVFATWEGEEAADGFLIELPVGWDLDSAVVLRDGYLRMPAELRRAEGRFYHIVTPEPLKGPHEVVLRLRPVDGYAEDRLAITPLDFAGGEYLRRTSLRSERRLTVVDRQPSRTNRALSFEGIDPFVLRQSRTPDLGVDRAYAVSLWLRTAALREVVASTWNGDDRRTYPLEMVVDGAGRLRVYRGRPGEHQSLVTELPVADGSWHLVTFSNHPDEGWARLAVDGRTVDSLYADALPRISMELPLVLGGRADGPAAYFDGLAPFSGSMDEVRVDPQTGEAMHLDFEEAVPTELVERPLRGARYEWTDLRMHDEVRDFRALPDPDGVILTWTAPGARTGAFVVERSYDGRVFEEVARLEPSRNGSYRLYDDRVQDGMVYYRLRRVTPDAGEQVSTTLRVGLGADDPESVVLLGNFPNPFNATTTVTYQVHETTEIHLAVWDLAGQPVATLVDQTQNPGVYEARFDANDLPSGTYFVRLRTPAGTVSHKMILMK